MQRTSLRLEIIILPKNTPTKWPGSKPGLRNARLFSKKEESTVDSPLPSDRGYINAVAIQRGDLEWRPSYAPGDVFAFPCWCIYEVTEPEVNEWGEVSL